MACEIEQQQVDLAVANLTAASAQRMQDEANLQQSTWAEMAAHAQLMMALMILQNCLNGGSMFGAVQMMDLISVSRQPDRLKAKVFEIIQALKFGASDK